jgi:hypothetical protein
VLRRLRIQRGEPRTDAEPLRRARSVRRVEGRLDPREIGADAFECVFEEVAFIAEVPVEGTVREPGLDGDRAGRNRSVGLAFGDPFEGIE